jgi:hypothetical protein
MLAGIMWAMNPLTPENRSQGGKRRADNPDRILLSTFAAHKRPILRDMVLSDDELLKLFRAESTRFGWLYYAMVGEDTRTIRSALPDAEVKRRLRLVGDVIGFVGFMFVGKGIAVYYRPLKRGVDVIDTLNLVSHRIKATIMASLRVPDRLPEDDVI